MKKLFILLFLVSISSYGQNQNFNQLDQFFDLLYQNNKIMGNISILKDGKPLYNKSIGYQYIHENIKTPISTSSKFRIGSVTKTFTSVMIFQLIDEGKIKLTDALSEYFPEVPNASDITIANMLNHSSGLFNLTEDENFNEHEPTTNEKLLKIIASHDVKFQPGEKNEYSNTNYVLLGYILEKIENLAYNAILKNRIVDKIQLKNTYYGGVINTNNNECLSYYYEDDASLHEAKQAHLSNPGGAGGIVSNPTDLVNFYDALFNGKLMSEKSFKTMTTIKGEYGSGIFSADKGGQTIFAHNGTIDFFKSIVVYIPEHNTAIALNANALDYSMMAIMFQVMDALAGRTLDMPSFGALALTLTEEEARQYMGVYSCEGLPFNLVFKAEGNVLKGAPEASDLKVLKPIKKDEFVLEALGVTLNFDLKAKILLFKQPGESLKKCIKKE